VFLACDVKCNKTLKHASVLLQANTGRRESVELDEPLRDSVPATSSDDDVKVTSQSHVIQPTDDLDVSTVDSLTLPRIEQVLRSEGVQALSITEQIDSLRKKVARYITRCNSTLQSVAVTTCSVFNVLKNSRCSDGLCWVY